MRKRMIALMLALLIFAGCSAPAGESIYEATYLTLFDTVTVIKGGAESKAAFGELSQSIYDELEYYHRLFDIYHDYEGINNLKTVNDMAGIAPVTVDSAIIDLLKDCRSYYELTGGKVNVAMGSVLQLWHEARTHGLDHPDQAKLPDMEALQAAAEHCDFDAVIIDESASTVYISDPELRLDVGAIAKGWATQRVAEKAPEGMLFSIGGNVLVTGGGAIKDPMNRKYLRMNGFVAHIVRDLDNLPMDGRPLSQNRDALEQMWQERKPLYEACSDKQFFNNGSLEACVQTIREAFDEALCAERT